MPSRIYIESAVREHPRSQQILARHPGVPVVEIEHYGEVFNPRAQNFRLQKRDPALILARKHRGHVLAAPEGYGLEGDRHYYFSHMLNCLYDCRYCFLQGMYRSAHHLVFVNYEDFDTAIRDTTARHPGEPVWFYSGYDCDSLASEPMTRFTEHFLPLFAELDNAWLELRTKSTQVRGLLSRPPQQRVVTAFSFTDPHSHRRLEHGVPSIAKRIDAMSRLMAAGWPVGLRLDPVVYHRDYQQQFRRLLEQLFEAIDGSALHSVSLGNFRLTRDHFRTSARLYPEEPLFAQELVLHNGIVSYPEALEREMIEFCETELLRYIPAASYQPCDWHG